MLRYRSSPSDIVSGLMRRKVAAARIQRAMRQKLVTMRRKKSTRGGVGVTTQHDSRRIYTKKRMPSYKKKPWRRFISKVHAVAEKELGSRTVVFNTSDTRTNTDPTKHTFGAFYLYGQQSQSVTYGNDLTAIGALEVNADPTNAQGPTIYNSTKILFQSGILDITFRNASTYTDSNGANLSGTAKMEVDVYEILVSKDTVTNTNIPTFGDMLNINYTDTDAINPVAGSTEINYDLRGVTPWDLTYVLSRFKVKILKKTKYMLPNGETFTYQVRDPKRRALNKKELVDELGFNKPGWTRVVYVVAKLVPGLTVGTTVGTYQEKLVAGITRKYFYKIEGVTEDRTRYING